MSGKDGKLTERTNYLVPESALRYKLLIPRPSLTRALNSIQTYSQYTTTAFSIGSALLGGALTTTFTKGPPTWLIASLWCLTGASYLMGGIFIYQEKQGKNEIEKLKEESEEEIDDLKEKSEIQIEVSKATSPETPRHA